MSNLTNRDRTSQLMYTPHPAGNYIRQVSPERLAEAGSHVHQIRYEALLDIHDIIWSLANVLRNINPCLVFFFATGGIPIVFPLMRALAHTGALDLVDGRVFHMFPGLAWDGHIDAIRPPEYFSRESVPLLRAAAEYNRPIRLVAIDTTNTGNAVNLAVKAIQNASTDAGPLQVDAYIVGIVNGLRATRLDGYTVPVRLPDGTDIFVLPPKDCTPTQMLVSRRFVKFSIPDTPQTDVLNLQIAYWVADQLFTEDKAELLGIAAAHKYLAVDATGMPGRMEITFANGRRSIESGLSAVGTRLLYLLENNRTSIAWRNLDKMHLMPAQTEEEQRHREETALENDAFMSLLEMTHQPQTTLQHLLSVKALLRPVQIFWLAQQDPFPHEAIPRVIAALRNAVPGRSDDDDQTVVEAAAFLRRAYTHTLISEPKSNANADVREFWLAIHQKIR
jgi:hypothetical protein